MKDGNRRGRFCGAAGTKRTTENRRAARDAREAVLLALLSYEKKDTFSNVLVRRTLDSCESMDSRERAFIKRLLEGVIERRTQMDALIVHYTGRPVGRLHPTVLQILRMGLYQIFYMDAVPDRAACDEAVRLIKRRGPAGLSGLVNGVLRRAVREKEASAEAGNSAMSEICSDKLSAGELCEAGRDAGGANDAGEKTASLKSSVSAREDWRSRQAVLCSTPEWLVGMWEEQFGRQETEHILSSLMEIRPVSARLRVEEADRKKLLEKLRAEGAEISSGRWLEDSFRLCRTSDLRGLYGFKSGLWTVQDESSMLAVEAAGIAGGEEIYDVCAAPGGKSFLAADRLLAAGGRGKVHSFDLSRRKTELIREGARRLHLSNILVEERDARIPYSGDGGRADILFCDLPCSGLGVIGKKRDIKYRASLSGISSLSSLQREILRSAVGVLRSGGVLIYSTCTISRQENEENADWIESGLGMLPDPLAPHLPRNLPGIDGNRVQLLPHIHGTDGFFIARFRKP